MTTRSQRGFDYEFSPGPQEFVPSVLVFYEPANGTWTIRWRSVTAGSTVNAIYGRCAASHVTETKVDWT